MAASAKRGKEKRHNKPKRCITMMLIIGRSLSATLGVPETQLRQLGGFIQIVCCARFAHDCL